LGFFYICYSKELIMKSKIVAVAALAVVLFSCASKTVAVQTAPTEVAKTTVLSPELVEGKNLYENSCARCHKLYAPTAYSKENWQPILTRMQVKAHLDDVKMASISNYISSQL
jgi:cytochrome c5